MKLILVCVIMAAAMNAQTLTGLPDLKIDLQGTVDVTALVNNSGRTVLGYNLLVRNDRSMPTRISIYRLSGIPSGSVDIYNHRGPAGAFVLHEVGPDGIEVVVQNISIDSVIFDNGEFAGPDISKGVAINEADFAAYRRFAALWSQVDEMAVVKRPDRLRRGMSGPQQIETVAANQLADELLSIQGHSGIEAARQAARSYSQLPKLWKGEKRDTTR